MSDNKLIAIIIAILGAVFISFAIFVDSSCMDTDAIKTLKAQEKTKQIEAVERTKQVQYVFKIDSLKAIKNGK